MTKLLFLYCSSFAATWISLSSLLFGLRHWSESGALIPVIAGALGLVISARLILATIRIFLPQKNDRGQRLIN